MRQRAAGGAGRGRRPGPGRGGRRPPRQPADPVRRLAFEVVRAAQERDAYANLLMPALLRERGVTGRDAAFATELGYGTLRGLGAYDAILAVCSDRPVDQIDPPVLDVLRIGAHQLLGTRVGSHAAVATSVDLAREVSGPGASGFVNAVLRRVASRDLDGWMDEIAPDPVVDPLGNLALRHSHPRWIAAAFRDALGEDDRGGLAQTAAALAAGTARPGVTLCVTPGRAEIAELAEAGAEPARWSPFGAYLASGDPSRIAAITDGRAAVQDEASQLAAVALARAPLRGPDSRWLDLSAGPGGKARLLAGLAAERDAKLVAADVRPHRARLVASATAAAGTAGVICADGTVPAWRPGAFDRVMADVPCSGLGALRRRPEARWRKSAADVEALGGLQRALLASALEAVRPGGVVAYVTCSPHVAETRAVLAAVLRGRADVTVLDAPGVLAEVPDLRCPDPDGRYAQFWPHRHGSDAIFVALLQRDEAAAAG